MKYNSGVPALRFPNYVEEWQSFTIQNLIEQSAISSHLDGNHGSLYPTSDQFKKEGTPYVTANDFIDGRVNLKNCKFLSLEKSLQFKKGIAKNGDVLFAHNATVGPTAILETELDFVILSTTATYFRCNSEKLINIFLKSYFETNYFVKQYSRVMAQSTRNQVPITIQRTFYIKLPSIYEQQKIASFLTAIDTKLQSLKQKKSLLEQYKKGVMQKLFSQEIRFKDEKGGVFPDWAEKKLGEIADIYQPKTISQTEFSIQGFDVFGANGIIGKYHQFNHEFPQIAITCRGNTCGTVNFTNAYSWITGNAMVLNLDNSKIADKRFLYFQLLNTDFTYLITGSGQPQITGVIKKHNVLIPDIREQLRIANFLDSINQKVILCEIQINKTEEYKKGLLQQMFC